MLARPLLAGLTTSAFVPAGQLVIPIVAFSMLCYGAYGIFGQVPQLFKHTQIFAIASGAGAALNVGLNLLLVPRFGLIGAAVSTLLAYAVAAVIVFRDSRKYMIFDFNPAFIGKCALASAVMSLAIWVLGPATPAQVALSVGGGAIIYFGVLFLLRGFGRTERGFLAGLAKDLVGMTPVGRRRTPRG